MKREELLRERLKRYSASETAAFHMPGHKRHMEYGLLRDFPNPFSIDITEIDGFDNLHHPEGILKDSMEWAAGVYGADHTYYLVNGSSCGILSAIGAVMRPGESILVSRNCHKSVYPQFLEAGVCLSTNHRRIGDSGRDKTRRCGKEAK